MNPLIIDTTNAVVVDNPYRDASPSSMPLADLADEQFRMMSNILDQEPGPHRVRLQVNEDDGQQDGS